MTDERPTAPTHLEAATALWWASVATGYQMEPHHLRLLTLAAEAWDRCQQARQTLATDGIVYRDRFNAPRVHPAVAIERDSRLAFARLLRELCLDSVEPPDSRPPRLGGD